MPSINEQSFSSCMEEQMVDNRGKSPIVNFTFSKATRLHEGSSDVSMDSPCVKKINWEEKDPGTKVNQNLWNISLNHHDFGWVFV
ncbi:hypothetical protein SUGI_1120660 [Cryptomeria japonica]|nr:hypothetical protein SUGI_1120660 [Cryptomeria japonica]